MHGLSFLFYLTFLVHSTTAYNILVTVFGVSGSQNLVMFRLAEQIAARGHSVTVLRAIIDPTAKTVRMKNVTELTFEALKDQGLMKFFKDTATRQAWDKDVSVDRFYMIKIMAKFRSALGTACELLLENEEIMNKVKSKKFDAAIIHMVDFCGFGLAHHLGIKGTAWFSTSFLVDFMAPPSGVPSPTSYVSSGMLDFVGPKKLTVAQRFKNFVVYTMVNCIPNFGLYPVITDVFRKKFSLDFPSVPELLSKTQLYLVNADPMFEPPRPILHNIVYVGGLTMSNSKPLSEVGYFCVCLTAVFS